MGKCKIKIEDLEKYYNLNSAEMKKISGGWWATLWGIEYGATSDGNGNTYACIGTSKRYYCALF
jgi:hypothetical protein